MAKGGGSQLSQLKSRLHSEGITDKRQQAKGKGKGKGKGKPKSNSSTSSKSSKEDALSRAQKLASIAKSASFNPFEERRIKPKHLTFGNPELRRAAAARPGVNKSNAIQARRDQLLPEYLNRNKSGGIIDRRFGENDSALNPEEKMLERFKKERLRESNRKSKNENFNLNDDDDIEDQINLTHFGMSLDGLDQFDDIGLGVEDESNIDKSTTDRNHFGGFAEKEEQQGEEEEAGPRSKAEIMKEVMAKSKLAKYERQQMKSADDEIRMELDDELNDIRGLLFESEAPKDDQEEEFTKREKASKYGDPSMTGPNAKPMAESKWGKKEDQVEKGSDPKEKEKEGGEKKPSLMESLGLKPSSDSKSISREVPTKGEDSYDSFVRSLAFERRAKPQDRLKTEEELVKEEAEKLKKAEENRLKRMRGEEDDEDPDGKRKRKRKGKESKRSKDANQVRGGDDLEDDFDIDGDGDAREAYGLGQGLEGRTDQSDEEDDEDEEDGEDEDGEDGDDQEEGENVEDIAQPGTEAAFGNEGDEEDSETEENLAPTLDSKPKKPSTPSSNARTALPFTFDCPTSHDSLLNLIEKHSITLEELPIVIKRIQTLYHPSLAEDNKFKLQAFLGVLLDHVLFISSQLKGSNKDQRSETEDQYEKLGLINCIVPFIFNLAKSYPLVASQQFVSKLSLMQRNLTRGLSKGGLNPKSKTWPSSPELILLRIVSVVFSVSDLRHPVCTPANLLMSQYLANCRIRDLKDLSSALFLSSLSLGYEKDSKRSRPEVMNLLHNSILILSPFDKTQKRKVKDISERFGIPTPDFNSSLTKDLALDDGFLQTERDGQEKPNLFNLLSFDPAKHSREDAESVKSSLLKITFELTSDFSRLYKGSTSYIELFSPFHETISLLFFPESSSLFSPHSNLKKHLEQQLNLSRSTRRALRLQAHKAIALPSHIPKFDQQGYNPRKGGGLDPDSARNEEQKLRALLKKEKKGAIRELRKDNQFLAMVREEDKRQEDGEYKKKMDKVMSGLQDERHEQKKLDKEKVRLKKKSGR